MGNIDNASGVDLGALFGAKKIEIKKPEGETETAEPQNDEYDFDFGRGPWLSVFNDALFEEI